MHVYSVAERRITRKLRLRSGLFGVAFTADGMGLITCTQHPILWDLATGKTLRHFGPFSDLCQSVDGRFAVTTSMGSDVRVWEIATGAFHRRLGANVAPRR